MDDFGLNGKSPFYVSARLKCVGLVFIVISIDKVNKMNFKGQKVYFSNRDLANKSL